MPKTRPPIVSWSPAIIASRKAITASKSEPPARLAVGLILFGGRWLESLIIPKSNKVVESPLSSSQSWRASVVCKVKPLLTGSKNALTAAPLSLIFAIIA